MKPLLPGATIGVLGGGQLGRMLALAARRMGYRVVVLDPSARCPTAQVADGVVIGALDDLAAATHLAKQVDVITLDTEHVPADVLDALEPIAPVRPSARVLRTIQDRLTQKQFLDGLGLPQATWARVDADDLDAALAKVGRPAILKVRRAGYDGKGQARVEPGGDARAALATLRGEPAVAEALVRFTREVSVILARGIGGEIRIFPVAENVHRRHVLHTTRAPAPMADAQRARAEAIAVAIAEALEHVGVHRGRDVRAAGRSAAGQRDRAAHAQQRALHVRRVRDLAVRAARARGVRLAARRSARAERRRDGEPDRRSLAHRRTAWHEVFATRRGFACTCTARMRPHAPAARWATCCCSMTTPIARSPPPSS